jgi:hypothetical protein
LAATFAGRRDWVWIARQVEDIETAASRLGLRRAIDQLFANYKLEMSMNSSFSVAAERLYWQRQLPAVVRHHCGRKLGASELAS